MAGSCTLRYTAPCHAAISDLTSQLTRIISYPPPSTLPAHKTLHNKHAEIYDGIIWEKLRCNRKTAFAICRFKNAGINVLCCISPLISRSCS